MLTNIYICPYVQNVQTQYLSIIGHIGHIGQQEHIGHIGQQSNKNKKKKNTLSLSFCVLCEYSFTHY